VLFEFIVFHNLVVRQAQTGVYHTGVFSHRRKGQPMQEFQRQFLDFAIQQGVLKFGQFELKSGRTSPYFFNAGLFKSGASLAKLGRFYAQAIINSGVDYDLVFGPAYKGIPLATATTIALFDQHQQDKPYCFNRKEAKSHGEGGSLVGAPLEGKVLIVDDVITAGTAIREAVGIIQSAGAELAGVVIALDRQETGQGTQSAIQEVEQQYNIPVISIVKLADMMSYLENSESLQSHLAAVTAYRQSYGIE